MIPRIIHQIWIQGLYEMPRRYRRWAATWAELNPDWEHRIWDETSLVSLMAGLDSSWQKIFSAQAEPLARADVARYCLLKTFGGLYADMDTTCLRPVGPLLEDSRATFQASFYRLPLQHSIFRAVPYDLLTNSIVASCAGHEVWNRVLKRLTCECRPDRCVVERTGPEMLWPIVKSHADEYPEDVRLIGMPEIHTAFHVPRRFMRLCGRFRKDLRIVDYNDSARQTVRESLRLRNIPRILRMLRNQLARNSRLASLSADTVREDKPGGET